VGRHDKALANLRAAARAGKKFGAIGYLITDWGDGGHPQPLAVSWPMLLAGAALAWNASGFDKRKLVPLLGRDVFGDANLARAAFNLGFAHQRLGVRAPNETPLGTAIAAPPAQERELFCRNGLKWFTRIPTKNIRATQKEIETQQAILHRAKPSTASARILRRELDLAARMAAESCRFVLWQQAVATGKTSTAKRLAEAGLGELRKLDKEFNAYWPSRNKATPRHCSAFLKWRIQDYSH
jgi:hypothetical protein